MFGRFPRGMGRGFGRAGSQVGGRRNNAASNPLFIMLMMQLLQQIQRMEKKPPVTLGLIGLMVTLYVYEGHPNAPKSADYALCPNKIVKGMNLARLIVPAFLHAHEYHLYHNMISLLWKGVNLEFKMGSEKFAKMVGILLVSSHSLVVMVSYAIAVLTGMSHLYKQCAVGFSAVLFALKVVLNVNSPAYSVIYGFRIPTRYAAWAELVIIHLLVPNSSFLGHLCGIFAGYLYTKCHLFMDPTYFTSMFSPLHPSNRSSDSSDAQQSTRSTRYTYQSGSSGFQSSSDQVNVHGRTVPETDEEMARRLQKEEEQSLGGTRRISTDELRRRRTGRFEK